MSKLKKISNPLNKPILAEFLAPHDDQIITINMYVDNTYRTELFMEEEDPDFALINYTEFNIVGDVFYFKHCKMEEMHSTTAKEQYHVTHYIEAYNEAIRGIEESLLGQEDE